MAKPDTSGLVSGSAATKVSLYGWVNSSIRVASTENESSVQVLDNSLSGSRFGIKASGALNKKTTASAHIEVGLNGSSRGGTDYNTRAAAPGILTRITDVSLAHSDMGTVTLGHGWVGGSGGFSGSFNGTNHVIWSIWGPSHDGLKPTLNGNAIAEVHGAQRHGGVAIRAFGTRMGRIAYATPSLMGLSLDASYNQDKSWSAGVSLSGVPSVKEVGLKLNGAFHSVPKDGAKAAETHLGVSAGFKHNASGLNVNGGYGQKRIKGGAKLTAWYADGGWSGKLIDSGTTAVQIGYGRWAVDNAGESTRYHFAANHSIASAATDLYFGASYDTGTYQHTVQAAEAGVVNPCGAAGDTAEGDMCEVERDGVFILIAGVRVKF